MPDMTPLMVFSKNYLVQHIRKLRRQERMHKLTQRLCDIQVVSALHSEGRQVPAHQDVALSSCCVYVFWAVPSEEF